MLALGLAVSLGVFAAWWMGSPFAGHPVLDAARYHAMGRAALSGPLVPEGPFHQAPLYPVALGLIYRAVGASAFWPGLLQVLLGALIPYLVYRLAWRVGGTGAGRAAAGLALLHAPLLLFAPRLLPTVPAIVLQLLFLDRIPARPDAPARALAVPGLLLGIATLLRPNLLLVPVLAAGMALWGRLPRRGVAVLLGMVALVVAPTTVHNLVAGGGLVLVSANAGETFAHGNHPLSVGTYTPVAGLRGADIFEQERVSRAIAEEASGRALTAAEVQRYWFGQGLRFIGEDPGAYLVLELRKLRLLLGAEEAPDMISPRLEVRRYLPLLWVLVVSLPVLLPLVAAGLRLAGGRLGSWWWLLVITHGITLLAFYVSNRYRLPLEALLLLPAGVGLAGLRERRAWLPAALGAVLALVLVLTTPGDRVRQAEGQVLTNLGTSLARNGDHAGAEARFREAVAHHPRWGRAHHYLGRTLALTGRTEEAVASLVRATELAPDDPEPRVDLVAALAATGEVDRARRLLDGLAVIPPELRLRVARLHLQLGNPDRTLRLLHGAPWSPAVGELRGMSLARTGDLDGAKAELERVVTATPSATRGWIALIDVHLRAGDCPGARARLSQGQRQAADPGALDAAVAGAMADLCGGASPGSRSDQ